MSNAPKIEKKNALYVGRRVNFLGAIRHCFIMDGKEVLWTGIKGVWRGHYYEYELHDGETLKMKTRPEERGKAEISQETEKEWDAKELIVREALARKRLRRQSQKSVEQLGDDMYKLKSYVKNLTMTETHSFVNALVNRLQKKARTERKKK